MASSRKTRRNAAAPHRTGTTVSPARREALSWLAGGIVIGVIAGVIGTTVVLRPDAFGLAHVGATPAASRAPAQAVDATTARIAALRERLAANPRDAGALLELAEVFAQAGRLEQAAAHVERALEVAGEDATVHVRAARLLRSLGAPDRALAAARRAMELDHDALAPALAAFDAALHGTGDLEAAREALEQARRRAPDDATVARAAVELEQIEKLVASAASHPDDYETLVKLGNFWYDTHRWEDAARAYQRALELRDGDPNVITDYGTVLFNLGKADEALSQFEHALFADPRHWQAAYNGVIVSLDRGDRTGARLWLDRLRQIRPDHPEIPRLETSLGAPAS